MTVKNKKFPEVLYIYREEDSGGDYYYISVSSISDIPDNMVGTKVAMYKLHSTDMHLVVKKSLEN